RAARELGRSPAHGTTACFDRVVVHAVAARRRRARVAAAAARIGALAGSLRCEGSRPWARSEPVFQRDVVAALGPDVDALTQARDVTLVGRVLHRGADAELVAHVVEHAEIDERVAVD